MVLNSVVLPPPLRPEHAQHLAGGEREADVAADRRARDSRRRARSTSQRGTVTTMPAAAKASSQKKNGVPSSAVSTPERHLDACRSCGPAYRRRAGKPAPSSMASGQQPREVRARPASRAQCGTTSPTQPMMPLTATAAGGHQCRRGDHDQRAACACPRRARAPRRRRSVMHVHAPAQEQQRHQAEQHAGAAAREVARRDRREAAEQPEGDRRQLVVRIGEVLEERDAGAEQRADDDAGEHQHEHWVVAAHREPQSSRPAHRRRARRRRQAAWIARHRQREEDPERPRRARRRWRRRGCRARPADCGTALVGGAGGGERRADGQRGEHPRPAHLHDHGFHVRGQRVRASRDLRREQGHRSQTGETG